MITVTKNMRRSPNVGANEMPQPRGASAPSLEMQYASCESCIKYQMFKRTRPYLKVDSEYVHMIKADKYIRGKNGSTGNAVYLSIRSRHGRKNGSHKVKT